MNWTKGNRIFVLFTIFLMMMACQYQPEDKLIISKWFFKSINKNNISQIRITETDYLELKSDSSFYYEIAFVNKRKTGKWHYKNHILTLFYQNPDTIRNFNVKILSKNDFLIQEDSLEYLFVKEK